jgi:4-amino-4-deoxy-L-arabinose transferase-like glycosyltransferase
LTGGSASLPTRADALGGPRWLAPNRATIAIIGIIGASAALRVALAACVGFGQDETYSVAVSRQLALSYFDHPPLHLWIVGLWARLVGHEDPWLLRLPFIALFAASSGLLYRLTAQAYGERAGLWALLALNLSPLFSVSTGSWVLPDGPLLCAALLAIWAVTRALATERSGKGTWGWWLLAGAAAGLALLSKYVAVFPILGLLLYLLCSRHRAVLATAGPWIAALLAAAVFAPALAWNAGHHWASFAFQGGRARSAGFSVERGAADLTLQCAYLLPWIAIALVAAVLDAFARAGRDSASRLFALLASVPIGFFALAGFWTPVLPHWAAIGWIFAFPLLGRWLARRDATHARALRWSAALSAGLLGALLALAASQARTGWADRFVAAFPAQDPTVELVDWRAARIALAQRGLLGAGSVVVAVSWIDAGRIDYALSGRVPVLCLSDDPREYAFLHDAAAFTGRDALIIANARRRDWRQRATPYFQRIEPLPDLQLLRAGEPVLTLALARGVGLSPLPRAAAPAPGATRAP